MLLALLIACGQKQPEWCTERNETAAQAENDGVAGYSYDTDCDGVPDALDRCEDSPLGDPTDRLGCTSGQASSCWVLSETPEDGEKSSEALAFTWSGDCDVYQLQFSDDPEFHPARTRVEARTSGREVHAKADETYWRVVGGLDGESSEATSPPRSIKWR